ncbi:MAG: lysostaphin resistance A-like protein [Candidatus Methylumidiphilus sp.]
MSKPSPFRNRQAFIKTATIFEASLVALAYGLGWWAGVDPLADLRLEMAALLWGLAGTLPLCLLFLGAYRIPSRNLRAIQRFLIDALGPLLDACRWPELLYLAVLAGVTEEVLFRGLLQPLIEARWGWPAGLALSNLLFALAHFVTPLYAVLAGLTGLYLGLSLDLGGGRNLLTPIAIHALYDFLAFAAVARAYRAERGVAF